MLHLMFLNLKCRSFFTSPSFHGEQQTALAFSFGLEFIAHISIFFLFEIVFTLLLFLQLVFGLKCYFIEIYYI